jgi:hypothetical protein
MIDHLFCAHVGPRTGLDRSPAISASPIEIVGEWLQNLLDPEVVNKVVAPDAIYVSLNTEDSELKRILPWAGTSHVSLYISLMHFGGIIVPPGYTDPIKFADGNPYGVSHVNGPDNTAQVAEPTTSALTHLAQRVVGIAARLAI